MPPVILSCVNLKGGVGKTALAVNFSAYCGGAGMRTLLIDLDPQTNATFCCMELDAWKDHAAKHGTVADLLDARKHANAEGKSKSVAEVVREAVFQGVDLIPSHLDLFTIDLDLAGAVARESKLRRAIEPILDQYDIIVCDCPPNLTIPTQNALAASSHYVVPISPDYLSGIGVGILISRLDQLMDDLDHKLKHIGIVISRVGRKAEHREETVAAMRQQFGQLVLDHEIKERVAISMAAACQSPIYKMKDREAAAQFRAVSQDLLDRIGVS
jgi:chromosome partitioning protein